MSKHFYSADTIFTSTEWLNDIILEVENNTITAMLPAHQVQEAPIHHIDGMIVPAFIDIQLYGAGGRLLSVYPDIITLETMADHCREGGTVLCLPTVATNTLEVSYRCIDAVQQYWAAGGKGVWGLHLEGPWIHPLKRGAHMENLIHPPTVEEVRSLLAYGRGVIKMITLAPEVCSDQVIHLIQEAGITISAGHSNASFAEATAAFNKGIAAVTHLYNAMSPLQHREPGMVGATLLHSTARASIIPDGYHVDFAAVRIAKQIMGERLFAITDAVTATGEGPYQHQLLQDRYEANGILSGSALTQHRSFMNLVTHVGVEMEEALRMCSLYPAQVIGADNLYGKIAPGYTAQFVVLDKQLQLADVITA